ncbi:Predicted outer membrane protein [Legionella wadsworthii]|uniref:Predicted outer membrane protein n=1 Tax=Legionella wadsworthii TaxID=28088 RepID=A0A378LW76_9GAMM|nr:DUF4142 domain-containing protein [Legionella wadsworthii]STY30271.1 Predicted outer membrane protein [Legionella wadsworthii]
MKSVKYLSFFLYFFVGALIFTQGSYAENTTNMSSEHMQKPNKKEGEILGTLSVVNKNEIAAAELAMKKSSNPQVKSYAKMLKKQHTQNLNEGSKLAKKLGITPIKNDKAKSLQKKGEQELHKLSSLNGKDFDKAYMKAMVKGHTDVLNMVDNKILPNVSNPTLKSFVESTRSHIQMHLDQGEKIQNELK